MKAFIKAIRCGACPAVASYFYEIDDEGSIILRVEEGCGDDRLDDGKPVLVDEAILELEDNIATLEEKIKENQKRIKELESTLSFLYNLPRKPHRRLNPSTNSEVL